ncbi:MAG: hypothetical protein KatS3mg060_0873 [Dehalococcoidia bacterium]|nr:MAG: hypothetical protein KatS3mg060_0873 [Dehalococcoidia bacterium]
MVSQNGRVVLLIDYDNFEICVRRDLQMIADLSPVVAYAQTLGTVVAARAYGSWDDPNLRMMVYRTGVEPAFAPVFQTSVGQQGTGKSVADTALVADGIDLLHLLRPDVLVVVSSDKDLMPLVRMARLRGTHVVVVGSDFTAAQLAQSADRLVTYRELVGGPRRRGVPMPRGQQSLTGAVQPSIRPPTGPAIGPVETPDEGVLPTAPVAPVAAVPAVAEPAPTEVSETTAAPKRRRRRRRGGRSEVQRTEESAAESTALEMDLAEAINEADIVDESGAERFEPAPMPRRAEPRPEGAPRPPGRLPFRRPEVIAQLETSRQPERAVQPRPRPEAAPAAAFATSPEAEPTPALAAEPLVEPAPPILEEIRRGEPPIGPIRAAAVPPRATEPEETAGIAAEQTEEDIEVVRPPLESLLGRVIVRGGDELTVGEAAIAQLAEESGGTDPGLAMIAADLEEQQERGESGRRRRRRRGGRSSGTTDGAPVEAVESRPEPDPLTIYFDAEGAPEVFREAAEEFAEEQAAPPPQTDRSRRRRKPTAVASEAPPATDPDTAELTPPPPPSTEAPPLSDPDTADVLPPLEPLSTEAPPHTDPDTTDIVQPDDSSLAASAVPPIARRGRSGRGRQSAVSSDLPANERTEGAEDSESSASPASPPSGRRRQR